MALQKGMRVENMRYAASRFTKIKGQVEENVYSSGLLVSNIKFKFDLDEVMSNCQ